MISSFAPGDTVTISQWFKLWYFRIESLFNQLISPDRFLGTVSHLEGPITNLHDDSGTSYQISRNGPQGPAGGAGDRGIPGTASSTLSGSSKNGDEITAQGIKKVETLGFQGITTVGNLFTYDTATNEIVCQADGNAVFSATIHFRGISNTK